VIHPNAKTGGHHPGPGEGIIYVVSGKARMRWGERLEFVAEAAPGDFIYVPPYVPHQEINASANEPLSCVLCRSGQEPIVVNLDIPMAETRNRSIGSTIYILTRTAVKVVERLRDRQRAERIRYASGPSRGRGSDHGVDRISDRPRDRREWDTVFLSTTSWPCFAGSSSGACCCPQLPSQRIISGVSFISPLVKTSGAVPDWRRYPLTYIDSVYQ